MFPLFHNKIQFAEAILETGKKKKILMACQDLKPTIAGKKVESLEPLVRMLQNQQRSIAAMQRSIDALNATVAGMGARLDAVDARLNRIDSRLDAAGLH